MKLKKFSFLLRFSQLWVTKIGHVCTFYYKKYIFVDKNILKSNEIILKGIFIYLMKHWSINKTSILDTLKHGPPISCLSTGYMNDQRIKFSTKILLLSCTHPVTKPINLEFHKIFNHILKFPPQISMMSLHAIHKILSISTNETLLSPPPFFFLLQNSHNFSFDLIDFRELRNFVTWSLLPTSNWTIYMRRTPRRIDRTIFHQ